MTVVMMPVNGRGIAHCKDMIKFTNFYIIYIKNEKNLTRRPLLSSINKKGSRLEADYLC